MRRAGHFALQLDEMTDVSGEAQLLAFVRYKDESDINEHVLFCKALPGKTTGEEIFQVIDSFFKEHDIEWTYCTHICTDGAAAMSGGVKGLLGQVKKVNTEIKWLHCIIHREALASKRVSPELSAVLDDAVKVINFIHSRPLNRRLFQTLCQESGTEHEQLLLHTDVRWLSRGKTLLRLYELHNEVYVFLKEHQHSLAVVFEDAEWVARLAYLADVFSKLNELNLSLQGKESHILNMYDKVKGFTKKLELWRQQQVKPQLPFGPLSDPRPKLAP
uniref:Transposase n=1 Tax=Knipowitschia caucasica TaxID=637954 RepID=A0AAV2MMX3_KNICA